MVWLKIEGCDRGLVTEMVCGFTCDSSVWTFWIVGWNFCLARRNLDKLLFCDGEMEQVMMIVGEFEQCLLQLKQLYSFAV